MRACAFYFHFRIYFYHIPKLKSCFKSAMSKVGSVETIGYPNWGTYWSPLLTRMIKLSFELQAFFYKHNVTEIHLRNFSKYSELSNF